VDQLAIYTFLDARDLEGYWADRLERIVPPPPETDRACTGGYAGTWSWPSGQIACYMDDTAQIRWTDDRSGMYGVLDATDNDLATLYDWWRRNGRRLGRPIATTPAVGTPAPGLTIPPTTGEPGSPTGFVCALTPPLADPLDRRWRITQVSFRRGGGGERVIFHLQREGQAAASESSVMVEPRPIDDPELPADTGLDAPSAGDTAITVTFGPGIRDATSLSHYAPRGVEVIRDISLHRLPSGYSLSSVGVTGDGCYQLRVPAFADPRANAQTIEVYLDIEP
jgi:hypothetical protein